MIECITQPKAKSKKSISRNAMSFLFILCMLCAVAQPAHAQEMRGGPAQKGPTGAEGPLTELKDEALSYFTPVTGKIVSVEGDSIKIDAGSQKSLKAGMRLNAFKEGVNFVHPVTKEPLGKIEMPVGSAEVTASGPNGSSGRILSGKPGDFTQAHIKIPGTKVKMLFYQGDVDWFLGDSYYQMLKESGRFELIDTGIEANDISKILAEAKAKGAEAALVLSSDESRDSVAIEQKLFWTSDAKQFSEKKVSVALSRIKELRFKTGAFGPKEGEVLLSFHLKSGADRIAVGDLDGDGEPEIILTSGSDVRIYKPGTDLKAMWDFKVPSTDEVLWVDCVNISKGKRDDIVITSMQNEEITSYIYELQDSKFVRLVKMKDTFLRRLGNEIIAQHYNKGEGYSGNVYSIIYADGAYKRSANLKLPEGINIYDFQYVSSPDGRQAILAWDERGYLNLYSDKGIRMWVSKEDFGGFSRIFKREAPTIMIDRGQWSIKDRLLMRDGEILAPKRKPLLGIARGLGYASSEIKSLWWNGMSVEERMLIESFGGNVLDYYPVGDKIIVLSKISLGLKAKNLLKLESPSGVMLYIFSARGR